MFTGIVAELGTVERVAPGDDGVRLRIATALAAELADGDSIAVNGVCLTASGRDDDAFEADVMNQTTSLTTIGELGEGDSVNLELALRASDRLGGHIVAGHVDAVAAVLAATPDGFATRLRVELPAGLAPLVAERGSVALDGVSLTVAAVGPDWLEVSLIPETLERTTLGARGEGDRVNLECDVIARHVARIASMTPLDEESES